MEPANIVVTPGAETTRITWDSGGLPSEAEYSDGTFWRTLFAEQDAEFYDWDTTHRKGAAVIVRIRTIHDLDVSEWVESDPFALTGKFSGNLWTAYLELGAALIWKMNDASGLPQDSSGNARHATTIIATTYGEDGIIYNRAAQDAIRHGGGSGTPAASRADVTGWPQTIKTMLFFMKPTTYGGSDSLAQITNRINIAYNNGTGVLSSGITGGGIGGGAALAWPSLPSTGATHMLASIAGGGRHAIYTDGAVVASRSIASPGAIGQDVYFMAAVGGTWNVTYQGYALFADELDALQIAWLYQVAQNEPNEPPTQPGAFTVPAAGDYDNSITVAHGASTDPEADPFDYEYERYNPETDEWEALALTVSLDTSEWLHRDGYKLRVRAYDDPYGEFSAWRESDAFDIVHARAAPATPAAPEWVGPSIRNLYFLAPAFSSPVPGATLRVYRWQYADNEEFTDPIEFTTEGRFGFLPEHDPAYSLVADTDHWVRMAPEDEIGKPSAWSPAARGRTSNEMGSPTRFIIAEDLSGNERHATMGVSVGSDGSSFLNHGAGCPSMRFPTPLIDATLPADAHGFYTGHSSQCADWRDDENAIDPPDDWSIMLRIIPMELTRAGLLGLGTYDSGTPMNSGNTGWWFDGGGVYVNITRTRTIDPITATDKVYISGPPAVGELLTVLLRGTGGANAAALYADDELVWEMPDGWDLDEGGGHFPESWIKWAHWGAAPNVGGPQVFQGIIVDSAFWSTDFLSGKTVAPSHAAILATIGAGLEGYYRFNDPAAPTTPVLAVEQGEA